MLKKIWLSLTQVVTVIALLIFVVITLKPQWLPLDKLRLGRATNNTPVAADPNANLNFKQAPASITGLSYHAAVEKAIPSVVLSLIHIYFEKQL